MAFKTCVIEIWHRISHFTLATQETGGNEFNCNCSERFSENCLACDCMWNENI